MEKKMFSEISDQVIEFLSKQKEFHFDRKTIFLGQSIWIPVIASICYLLTLAILQYLMNQREKPLHIPKIVSKFHNALLVIYSFWSFVSASIAGYERVQEDGNFVDALVCSHRSPENLWDGRVGFVLYFFYLSKYYEYFDTILMVLQKKKLILLHVWHHSVMPIFCLSWFLFPWFEGSWWATVANSFIHTVMYSYYYLSIDRKVNWKMFVTTIQIIQFITGFVFIGAFLYKKMVEKQPCTGNEITAMLSMTVNFSFLILFSKFYIETYFGRKGKTAKNKKQKSM